MSDKVWHAENGVLGSMTGDTTEEQLTMACNRFSRLPESMTDAPLRANIIAAASPMPLVAPATKATFS